MTAEQLEAAGLFARRDEGKGAQICQALADRHFLQQPLRLVTGTMIPGVSTVEGAIAGGIAGAVLGAVVNGRQYYRDTRGYCYYVDQYGRPIYDYNVRC